MAYREGVLDPVKRAHDKQASRDRDERLLASGAVSPAAMNKANGFFSSLPVHEFEIVSIGGRLLEKPKR